MLHDRDLPPGTGPEPPPREPGAPYADHPDGARDLFKGQPPKFLAPLQEAPVAPLPTPVQPRHGRDPLLVWLAVTLAFIAVTLSLYFL